MTYARHLRKGGVRQRAHRPSSVWNDRVLTLPNLISFARLCLIPLYICLLLSGRDLAAAATFAFAASTDFVDGQIARRTNSVSRLGQMLDPLVDRALMVSGVLGIYLVGRLPLWTIVVIIARDLLLLGGSFLLLRRHGARVPVVFIGKVATTLLFTGFTLLLVNWPHVPGLGVIDVSWLPGFGAAPACLGIWLVYVGLAVAALATAHYLNVGLGILLHGAQARDYANAGDAGSLEAGRAQVKQEARETER